MFEPQPNSSQETPLEDWFAYQDPTQFCDIVMKGGITSGVAYPLAICELARHYSFKNIGGTSAGAIAAAATAAAEYNRRTKKQNDDSGFAQLAKLPGWLSGPGNLAGLFQPNPSTQPLFNLLDRLLRASGGSVKKLLVLVPTAWSNFWLWALSGAIIGLVVIVPIVGRTILNGPFETARTVLAPIMFGYSILFGVALVLFLATIFCAFGILLRIRSVIPGNFYGLTTGLLDPDGHISPPALTTWLADEIDRIAGKQLRKEPLTFGDLRGAVSDLDRERLGDDVNTYGIQLQMMTTNLTLGRPYRLPFDDQQYFYDPEEWKHFFPNYIMKWLDSVRQEQGVSNEQLIPLPAADKLPVVVAARMSLSFPILISAVPLWTVDYSRVENQGDNEPVAERCLFSDGGIGSNFPIHFFDQPLPRWPTFGIDLQSFHPDYPKDEQNECENSYLVRTASAGRADTWDRFDDKDSGLARLAGFFTALINTMYNWADNAQVRVPGYRDRIIHIFQTEQEGGMNLNMPPELIRGLSERGRCAGVKLRERFTGQDGSPLTWANHRWIRFRSMMALVERMLSSYKRGYQWPHDEPMYPEMIRRDDDEPPNSYRWRNEEQQNYAEEATHVFVDLAREWEREQARVSQSFADGEPRPSPELRIRPRI